MFTKILIANRGEIACRVIKTAKRLGIRTVAVYSDADQHALHVQLADEAIHIGAAPSSESYLVSERIIAAAQKTQAQAIHPGYGFLSENAEFAKACASNNLVFIGPPASAIDAMGSKSAAKAIMEKANVPLVPGYHGSDQNPTVLKQSANSIGYPVLLKAVAGGGGKGMRQVWNETEFDQALADAQRESMASFGNSDMLIEKYLTQPRHVEFQIFCDNHDNGVYLFERDCSVQRRHQKVVEEAPAPNMSDELRKNMGETALRAAQAIDYRGAGTIEFLLDTDQSFYFMEMNTRLQVEHPVTEMITGEDLVEWQLRVANNDVLPKQQHELSINGHAIEARVYAEDPNNDFLPTTGKLSTLIQPVESDKVRIDTGVVEGDTVSPFYDPMIAKLVIWDSSRAAALTRTAEALKDYRIAGLSTNLHFLYTLVSSKPFVNAELDTGFIEKHSDQLFKTSQPKQSELLTHAALFLILSNTNNAGSDPWDSRCAWRANQANQYRFDIQLMNTTHHVVVECISNSTEFQIRLDDESLLATATLSGSELTATINGHQQTVTIAPHNDAFVMFGNDGATEFSIAKPDLGDAQLMSGADHYAAPMNGTVAEVLVAPGDSVTLDQPLLVMEAMKMQHTIRAAADGTVTDIYFKAGDLVDGGTALLDFSESEEST